jgi:uncharacterized protein (TIGR02808 family)
MSTLESVIWHVLGYSAIPMIVITGIVGSILIYQLIVKLSGIGDDD